MSTLVQATHNRFSRMIVKEAISSNSHDRLPKDNVITETPSVKTTPYLAASEETLVIDHRSGVRPAQQVERKLVHMLRNALLPMSHARLWSLNHCRRHC